MTSPGYFYKIGYEMWIKILDYYFLIIIDFWSIFDYLGAFW